MLANTKNLNPNHILKSEFSECDLLDFFSIPKSRDFSSQTKPENDTKTIANLPKPSSRMSAALPENKINYLAARSFCFTIESFITGKGPPYLWPVIVFSGPERALLPVRATYGASRFDLLHIVCIPRRVYGFRKLAQCKTSMCSALWQFTVSRKFSARFVRDGFSGR